MQMWRCGSGEALTCGSVEMRKRGSVEVWKRGSVEVWKCRSVEVWKCGSVEVWTEEAKTGKSHRKRKNRDKAPLRYVPPKVASVFSCLESGPVIECIFYCLLHMESLVKCKMYPQSTPVLRNTKTPNQILQ